MFRKARILSRERLFDGFFNLERVRFTHETYGGSDSLPIERLNFVIGRSAAAIVYNTTSQEVILVEQFRLPTFGLGDGWLTEIVAGLCEQDESPDETIRRELLEEIGYKADKIDHICSVHLAPGSVTEFMTIFYAEVSEQGKFSEGGGLDHDEDIRVVRMRPDSLWRAIERGDIADAKTLIAAQWLRWRIALPEA